jgi:hypothetical protein
MISIGAGAALAGLVSAVPQLVWLSAHKTIVFGVAGITLSASGIALWNGRMSPCPVEPRAAQQCRRLRRMSTTLYVAAVAAFALGAFFAFVLPVLSRSP